MDTFAILADERIASIREIQKNPSRMLRGITRVTRGSKTVGFFLSSEDFADLVENQEALASGPFVKRIAQARRDIQKNKGVPLKALVKEYGV